MSWRASRLQKGEINTNFVCFCPLGTFMPSRPRLIAQMWPLKPKELNLARGHSCGFSTAAPLGSFCCRKPLQPHPYSVQRGTRKTFPTSLFHSRATTFKNIPMILAFQSQDMIPLSPFSPTCSIQAGAPHLHTSLWQHSRTF